MARHSIVIGEIFIIFIACVALEPTQDTTSENVRHENVSKFKWYDGVTANKVDIMDADRDPLLVQHLGERSKLYRDVNGTYKLGATNFVTEFSDSISWTNTAGFVDTVFYGYQQHHNVIIRPDDIWTAILVQFSLYVNANAEALRSSFVNFEEKEQLIVKFRSRIDRIEISEFIQKMITLIQENINPSVYNWILPTFTTTTDNDKLTAGVAMMATLREYFDYELWGIICGIPEAIILGTLDDWKDLRNRVRKLNEFEVDGQTVMAQWSYMLGLILDEFVDVKKGNPPNAAFWKGAIRVDYIEHDFICAKVNETSLNGWITTFSAFNLGGKWRGADTVGFKQNETSWPWLKIRTDKLTPGHVQVPIKIHDEYAKENERNYNGAIITGHMGYSVKPDRTTLQPLSGYIMTITNEGPEYLRKKLRSG